jgi:polyisoprenoid-binding protein YceI
MRDNHLKAAEYFDAEHYPRITMKSTSFKQKGSNNFLGLFNMTIKGKTKVIEVPFTYTESGNAGLFKGSFKFNRQDFGIGGKSMVLSDEVTVMLTVETNRQ